MSAIVGRIRWLNVSLAITQKRPRAAPPVADRLDRAVADHRARPSTRPRLHRPVDEDHDDIRKRGHAAGARRGPCRSRPRRSRRRRPTDGDHAEPEHLPDVDVVVEHGLQWEAATTTPIAAVVSAVLRALVLRQPAITASTPTAMPIAEAPADRAEAGLRSHRGRDVDEHRQRPARWPTAVSSLRGRPPATLYPTNGRRR